MGNLKLCFAWALLLSGCGSNLGTSYGETKGAARVSEPPPLKITGSLNFADGSNLDLAQVSDPLVLMFVTYTCISCREEALALVEHFRARSGLPVNAKLVTVMVGGSFSSAEKWKTKVCDDGSACVTWPVGVNEENKIFEELCPERLTPCVFTQNHGRSPAVVKRIGLVNIADLEKETGPWQY